MIDKIVDYQIKEKYIQEKEKNIYRYAYTVFIEECINIIISFFIGIFFRKLLFTICYLFSYISLRKFAGGYHSKSKWNCRVISLFLIVFSCVFDELFFETIKRENLYLFDIIAQIIILILTPIEAKEKKLGIEQKKDNRIITIKILLFQEIFLFISIIFNFVIILKSIICSHIMLSIMMIIGRIKNNS